MVDIKKYLDSMTPMENEAINIYNAWAWHQLTWAEALALFTDEMRADKGGKTWYEMIFKEQYIGRDGVTETEPDTEPGDKPREHNVH